MKTAIATYERAARVPIDLAGIDELPLAAAQDIAEMLLGSTLAWNGGEAPCVCPGIGVHTNVNADSDCHVIVAKAQAGIPPGVYCHHGSCRAVCEEASQALRKALGTHRVFLSRIKARVAQGAGGPVILTPSKSPVAAFDAAKLEAIARKLDGADAEWFAARSKKQVANMTPGELPA